MQSSKLVIIGRNCDLKLPESHGREYGNVSIVDVSMARAELEKYKGVEPEIGVVYIKHPFADVYIANNDLLDVNLASVMVSEISSFAKKLGALTTYSSIEITEKNWLGREIKLSASNGSTASEGSSKRKRIEEKLAKLTAISTLDNHPGKLSAKEYEEAKRIYESSHFLRFCDMGGTCKNMLDFRNPDNRLNEGVTFLHFSASIYLSDTLKVAGALKKASILKASASFAQNKKYFKKFEIVFYTNFTEQEKIESPLKKQTKHQKYHKDTP